MFFLNPACFLLVRAVILADPGMQRIRVNAQFFGRLGYGLIAFDGQLDRGLSKLCCIAVLLLQVTHRYTHSG